MQGSGSSHELRKQLLTRALSSGRASLSEIERALTEAGAGESERRLFRLCLRVSGLKVVAD